MKFLKWFYHVFLGTAICYGETLMLWLIIYAIWKVPQFNFQNALFLLEIIAIPWLINFIFHYNSSILVKGTLHSILWLMLSIILFGMTYEIALDARLLIIIMVLFFLLYGIGLAGINYCSKKINTPLRHTGEFLFKFINLLEK